MLLRHFGAIGKACQPDLPAGGVRWHPLNSDLSLGVLEAVAELEYLLPHLRQFDGTIGGSDFACFEALYYR